MTIVTLKKALYGVDGGNCPPWVSLPNLMSSVVHQRLVVVEHISMGVKDSTKERGATSP